MTIWNESNTKHNEALRKLISDFKYFYEVQKNVITFYKENPDSYKARYGVKWKYHMDAEIVLSRNGVIKNNRTGKEILLTELKNEADLSKAFTKIYEYRMRQEIEKWKTRVKKGTHDMTQVPVLVLQRIKPKLAQISRFGIFD